MSERSGIGCTPPTWSLLDSSRAAWSACLQDVGDGLEHQCHYAPVTMEALERRLGIKLKPHPDKVAEAAALSSLQAPPLKYALALPKEILLGA